MGVLLGVLLGVTLAEGVIDGVTELVGVLEGEEDGHTGGNATARYTLLLPAVVDAICVAPPLLALYRHTVDASDAGAVTAYTTKSEGAPAAPASALPVREYTGSELVPNRTAAPRTHAPPGVSAHAYMCAVAGAVASATHMKLALANTKLQGVPVPSALPASRGPVKSAPEACRPVPMAYTPARPVSWKEAYSCPPYTPTTPAPGEEQPSDTLVVEPVSRAEVVPPLVMDRTPAAPVHSEELDVPDSQKARPSGDATAEWKAAAPSL